MCIRDSLESVRARVREAAGHACGYCQSPQHLVMGKLEIEHIVPRARGGSDEESNLWLSCSLCNRYKGSQTESRDAETNEIVRLFNPRTDDWHENFAWISDGVKMMGLTPIGRATVIALNINNEVAVEVRRNWVLAGRYPPKGNS